MTAVARFMPAWSHIVIHKSAVWGDRALLLTLGDALAKTTQVGQIKR